MGICLPKSAWPPTSFNISDLIPFVGGADIEEEELRDLRTNPLQGGGDDAIHHRTLSRLILDNYFCLTVRHYKHSCQVLTVSLR